LPQDTKKVVLFLWIEKSLYALLICFQIIKLMNEEIILNQLEELAGKLEIVVRDENINIEESSSNGGLCRIDEEYILILNSKATVKEKIHVMIKALQQFDLSGIYIKPVIRELLEGYEK